MGTAPSAVAAPWADPSYQIWTINGAYAIDRNDVHFQMHTPTREHLGSVYAPDYLAWLEARKEPTYMLRAVDWIPSSIEFPLAEMVKEFGLVWGNTVCFALALAIRRIDGAVWSAIANETGGDRRGEIAICGTDLISDEEYQAQREWVQRLIGVAQGRGIKVTFPGGSALSECGYRYGYDETPHVPEAAHAMVQRDIDLAAQAHEAAAAEAQRSEGARLACLDLQRVFAQHPQFSTDSVLGRVVNEVLGLCASTQQQRLGQAMGQCLKAEGAIQASRRTACALKHVARGGTAA